VLELSSQGLTQQEIANRLLISQKTVSNDLTWLKKDAVEFIKRNREHIAFEYKQAMSNFYQLRKEAWKHFSSTKNDNVKTNLYGVIESINNNIMHLLSAGDMIELELLQKSKEQAEETREDLNRTFESSEAKF
jgi:DNA-binding transcriptional regulator LsrR (DeoR family)